MGFGRTDNNNEILQKWHFNDYFLKGRGGWFVSQLLTLSLSIGKSVNLSDNVYSYFCKNVQTDMELKCYWSRI